MIQNCSFSLHKISLNIKQKTPGQVNRKGKALHFSTIKGTFFLFLKVPTCVFCTGPCKLWSGPQVEPTQLYLKASGQEILVQSQNIEPGSCLNLPRALFLPVCSPTSYHPPAPLHFFPNGVLNTNVLCAETLSALHSCWSCSSKTLFFKHPSF